MHCVQGTTCVQIVACICDVVGLIFVRFQSHGADLVLVSSAAASAASCRNAFLRLLPAPESGAASPAAGSCLCRDAGVSLLLCCAAFARCNRALRPLGLLTRGLQHVLGSQVAGNACIVTGSARRQAPSGEL